MAAARLRALWEHPAGLKTVFFWAPTMKWGLVIAGLSDMNRPVEKVSIPQCTGSFSASSYFLFGDITALALTGVIWTRYSFQITPVNPNLAAANIFVALTNIYQLSRVALASNAGPSDTDDSRAGTVHVDTNNSDKQ